MQVYDTTINESMVKINKTLDGTLEKAIDASTQLSKMPGFVQDFMLGGDFDFGGAKKVKTEDLGIIKDNASDSDIQNLAAQLAGLDKSQQSTVFKMSDLSDAAQNATKSLLGEANAGKLLSGELVDDQLKTLSLTQTTREQILQQAKLADASGKYRLAAKDDVQQKLEQAFATDECSEALKAAGQSETQLAASIVSTVVGQQVQTAATWAQKLAIDALAGTLAIAKQALVAFAIGFAVKKIQEWYKSVTEVDDKLVELANDAKETADKATQLSSSVSDLISQYEKLGDSSNWDKSDLETAKSLNEEIVETLKNQDGINNGLINQIDLQNGKYKEQLELLRQIQREQLEAANKNLTDEQEDEGAVLTDTAKKKLNTNPYLAFDSKDKDMIGKIQNVFGGTVLADNPLYKSYQFEDIDLNDPDSVLERYNELKNMLSYLEKQYKSTDLAESKFYQHLKNEASALNESAEAYQSTSDALKTNSEQLGKFDISDAMKATTPVDMSAKEIDAKIKASEKYKKVVKEVEAEEAKWYAKDAGTYGNIHNFERDKIDWNDQSRRTYSDFAKENPDEVSGDYSTVLGQWQYLDEYSDKVSGNQIFAFTPMLQTDSGLIPLTSDQLWNYFNTIIDQATNEDGEVDISKLMTLDAAGLDQKINGEMVRVKGMIAGVQGGTGSDGKKLSAADIMAMSGSSNEEIAKDVQKMYNLNLADMPDSGSNLSSYIGRSMHACCSILTIHEK